MPSCSIVSAGAGTRGTAPPGTCVGQMVTSAAARSMAIGELRMRSNIGASCAPGGGGAAGAGSHSTSRPRIADTTTRNRRHTPRRGTRRGRRSRAPSRNGPRSRPARAPRGAPQARRGRRPGRRAPRAPSAGRRDGCQGGVAVRRIAEDAQARRAAVVLRWRRRRPAAGPQPEADRAELAREVVVDEKDARRVRHLAVQPARATRRPAASEPMAMARRRPDRSGRGRGRGRRPAQAPRRRVRLRAAPVRVRAAQAFRSAAPRPAAPPAGRRRRRDGSPPRRCARSAGRPGPGPRRRARPGAAPLAPRLPPGRRRRA